MIVVLFLLMSTCYFNAHRIYYESAYEYITLYSNEK